MRNRYAFPILTLAFAAPLGLMVLLARPLWHGPAAAVSDGAEAAASLGLVLGLGLVAATLVLGRAGRRT